MLSLRPYRRSNGALSSPRGSVRRTATVAAVGAAAQRRPAAPAGASPLEPETRMRVLVVDDERSIRALCRVNLQLAGLEVLEAEDGEEALQQVERSGRTSCSWT